MAKHPVPGRVKTRLAAALGADTACALYRAFVLDLAERLGGLPYAVTWAYTPPDAPFAELLPGARCRPQHGRDLGERLAAAIADELAEAPGAVLAIGADAPHVPAAALAEAAGLAVHLLPPGFDVDEVADLVRLRALLARGEVRLPRTTEVLAVLALRS